MVISTLSLQRKEVLAVGNNDTVSVSMSDVNRVNQTIGRVLRALEDRGVWYEDYTQLIDTGNDSQAEILLDSIAATLITRGQCIEAGRILVVRVKGSELPRIASRGYLASRDWGCPLLPDVRDLVFASGVIGEDHVVFPTTVLEDDEGDKQILCLLNNNIYLATLECFANDWVYIVMSRSDVRDDNFYYEGGKAWCPYCSQPINARVSSLGAVILDDHFNPQMPTDLYGYRDDCAGSGVFDIGDVRFVND